MSPSSSSDRPPFENSSFLSVEGISLHYRVWRPEERAVRGIALLVHGFGGSTFAWRLVAPRMALAGWYTIAVDLPGFGFSSREAAESMNDWSWARLMWEFAGALEKSVIAEEEGPAPETVRRWNLLGHSLGGRIVAGMAAQRPQRVRRIVFIDAALHGPPAALPLLGLAPVRWLLGRWLETQILTEGGVARLLLSAYGREATEDEVRGYLRPLLAPGTVPVLLRLGRSMPEISESDLASISCRALIVWGERDGWIEVKHALRVFNDLPNAEIYVIPGAAHSPIETHPQDVIERLDEFL